MMFEADIGCLFIGGRSACSVNHATVARRLRALEPLMGERLSSAVAMVTPVDKHDFDLTDRQGATAFDAHGPSRDTRDPVRVDLTRHQPVGEWPEFALSCHCIAVAEGPESALMSHRLSGTKRLI
jgi:hypothetical protein